MGWVEKLNQWALKSIRPEAIARVAANPEGIALIRADGKQFIRWSDVEEIAVVKQPQLAGGSFALAVRGVGSVLVMVDDTVAGYGEFCQELPRRLKGAASYEGSTVGLLATSDEDGKVIFRRGAS